MSRKIGEPCGWYRTTDPAEVACANPAPVHHLFSSGVECWTCEGCALDLTSKYRPTFVNFSSIGGARVTLYYVHHGRQVVLELGVALDKMARTIPDHPTKANLLKYAETYDDAAKTLRRIAETMR